MIDWGQIIQTALEAVLTIALPVVVGYAITWLRAQREALLARLDEKARFMVQDAVRIAVQAAEQSGLAKHIADKAEEKKRFALDFAENSTERFLRGVDQNRLFIAPNGPLDEPLDQALVRYWRGIAPLRSPEWVEANCQLPKYLQVLNGIAERLGPMYHLIENSQELRSHPLMCLEQHAHYLRIIARASSARLGALGFLEANHPVLLLREQCLPFFLAALESILRIDVL